jgi:hypothetical protein
VSAAPGTLSGTSGVVNVPVAGAPSDALEHLVEHGCPDCTTAAQRAHWQFSDCPGCRSRALGRLKLYPHGGPHTRQYRGLLAAARVTHDQVREARALDSLHRETAAA